MAAVRHLTEAEFAEREGISLEAAKKRRRNGDCPKYLLLAVSRTKQTIRYPLAWVEEWELSRCVDPAAV